MPLERCQIEDRPGWRFGATGKCYVYSAGSEESEAEAKASAAKQGAAIEASRARTDLEAFTWYRDHPRILARADRARAAVRLDVRATAIVRLRDAKPRGRKVQPAAFPKAIEARYVASLRRRPKETYALLLAALERALKRVGPDIDERARADTKASDLRALLRVVTQIERAVEGSPPDAGEIEILGGRVAAFTAKAVERQIASVIGIDITARASTSLELVEGWVADNVDLITSIDSRFFDEVREAVQATVLEGRSTASLMAQIEDRYGVSQSRAELIARDQIGKLNSQVTASRQQALGIESYRWVNVGDQRVRIKHRNPPEGELGGTIRRWDDPHPTEGHPGDAVQCRCSALPVF